MRTILVLFVLSNTICAQITYNSSDHFEIGSEAYYLISNVFPSNSDFATTGETYEWDFSDLTTLQRRDTIRLFDPNDSGYKSSYCLANFFFFNCDSNFDALTNMALLGADSLGFGTLKAENLIRHFRKTNDKYEETMFGATILTEDFSIPVTFDFSEPDVVLQFPFTYESSDSSKSRLDGDLGLSGINAQLSRNRKRINVVDGYGSLLTAQGFYEDVLRMKTIIYNEDTTNLDGIMLPFSSVEVEYKWFANGYSGSIMTANGLIVNGNEEISEVRIRDEGLLAFTASKSKSDDILIFPNPFEDEISIQLPDSKHIKVQIHNQSGALIYSASNLPGIVKLNLELNSGIYILVVADEDGITHVQKLVRI